MKKVLVTGGAGFIGSHLVDKLIENGYSVTVLDDLSNGKKEFVHPKANLVKKSICDDIEGVFVKGKFDYVFHLAAKVDLRASLDNPVADSDVNLSGSLNVIENCIKYKIQKVIFASSAAVYAPSLRLPIKEVGVKVPQSPYGIAKSTVEAYLRVLSNVHGFDYVSLRFSNVYGPRQGSKGEGGVVSVFMKQIVESQPLSVFGDGRQTRDYIYVSDVVDALYMSLGLKGIYNVSNSMETSVNELVNRVVLVSGIRAQVVHKPAPKNEVQRNSLSNKKIRKFGWKPKVNLNMGLKKTFDWFNEGD